MVRGKDGITRPMTIARKTLVRRAMAAQVARRCIELVKDHHVNENAQRVQLEHQWIDVYSDPAPDMRLIGPSQRGKSLYILIKKMAMVSLGLRVGWVMSKEPQVRKFVAEKVNPTILNTDLYAELLSMSGGSDAAGFKQFGESGCCHYVSANSARDMTSFTADAMLLDEYDLCHKGNVAMAPSRMGYSPYRLTVHTSTPTAPGVMSRKGQSGSDNICSEFLHGTQNHYYSRCESCGKWQWLDWWKNVVDATHDETGRVTDFQVRDLDYSPGKELRVCCVRCRRPFDRLKPGMWVPKRPEAIISSRWIEPLALEAGPSLEELLGRYEAALSNPGRLEQFTNMDLARPFYGGSHRFSPELFRKCQGGYRMRHAGCDTPSTMGIDVNRPFLDVQISTKINGVRRKMWAGKMTTDIDGLVRKVEAFKVRVVVIDNQPELDLALRVQDQIEARTNAVVIRCKYASDPNANPLRISEAGEHEHVDPPRLITVNNTSWIDKLFELMQTVKLQWFDDWRGAIDGQMIEEFTTPVRKLVESDMGIVRPAWIGKPDHQLHAAVYDMIAGEVWGAGEVDLSGVGPVVVSANTKRYHDDDDDDDDNSSPLVIMR